MPKRKSRPRRRDAVSQLSPELEIFLRDGFDMFGDFEDWSNPGNLRNPEAMRQAWLTHKDHILRAAEDSDNHGWPGRKPWAYFAFEAGNPDLFQEQEDAHNRPEQEKRERERLKALAEGIAKAKAKRS